MSNSKPVSFGDNVRIIEATSTVASGHAGQRGSCFGWTTPSITGVEVIGGCEDDYALNIGFEAEEVPDAWFDPCLVEFVDHHVGGRISIGDNAFIRAEDGSWTPAS